MSCNKDANVALALSIDRILERILVYVMWDYSPLKIEDNLIQEFSSYQPHNALLNKQVGHLRLVNRSWHQATTRLLRKSRDHLFFIGKDDEKRQCLSCPGCWTKCVITPFVDAMMSHQTDKLYLCENADEGSLEVPTFKLNLTADFFKKENQDKMANILVKLGSGLVMLRIQFPADATMAIKFPEFKLPRLESLTVNCDEILMNGEDPLAPQEYCRRRMQVPTRNFQEFLQAILNASPQLKTFMLDNTENMANHYFPSATFTEIRLPTSLTGFDFHLWKPACLKILLAPQNRDLQLTTLHLYGRDNQFRTEMIYNVLKMLENSLVNLFLVGPLTRDISENKITKVEFPVMNKLETLEMLSGQWTLERGVASLAEKFPKLKTLALIEMKYCVFNRQWTNGSVYKNVNKLSLQIVKGSQEEDREEGVCECCEVKYRNDDIWIYFWEGGGVKFQGIDYPRVSQCFSYLPLTKEIIQNVHQCFPSISDLHMSFLEASKLSETFKYFYTELKNLKKVELVVIRDPSYPAPDGLWDEVLTGFSVGLMGDFGEADDEITRMMFEMLLNSDQKKPSIRDLENLESLFLSMPMDSAGLGEGFLPVISDVAFLFGFLRMSKLKHLKLGGGFKPTAEMESKWVELHGKDNGSIKYLKTLNMRLSAPHLNTRR